MLDKSQQEKLAQHTIKALQVTRDHFRRDGDMGLAEAHVISFDEQGDLRFTLVALDMPPASDQRGREQMAMAVQAECLLRDAVAVLFISEVWTLKDASPEELRKYRDWSKNPRARAEIMAILETYEETVTARMPVIRRKHGKAEKTFEIKPLERSSFTGRFSHFLPFRARNAEHRP